jgi:chemotaxis-related protein WspB
MLQILFYIGDERYALDSRDVAEIVPLVHFKEIPRAPDYVLGVFLYRGVVTPALDLCRLAGKPRCRNLMSTRIILVHYPVREGQTRLLGLVAERVTDTAYRTEGQVASPGVAAKDAPWLGGVASDSRGLIQAVRVGQLLTDDVRAILFPEEGAPS